MLRLAVKDCPRSDQDPIKMLLRISLASLLLVMTQGVFAQDEAAGARADAPRAKVIVGATEEVFIPALGLRLPAKIDTGAESASLSAINIKRFLRKGEKWVRFDLAVEGMPPHTFELPLYRNVRITRRASDFDADEDKHYSRRPKVQLELCIGDRISELDVNLADRRRFSQPMLLGKDALRSVSALVDVEAEHVMGVPRCEGAAEAEAPMADTEPAGENG